MFVCSNIQDPIILFIYSTLLCSYSTIIYSYSTIIYSFKDNLFSFNTLFLYSTIFFICKNFFLFKAKNLFKQKNSKKNPIFRSVNLLTLNFDHLHFLLLHMVMEWSLELKSVCAGVFSIFFYHLSFFHHEV